MRGIEQPADELGYTVEPGIRVGFVLSPDFTLLAFAGFVDTLRHSADEADRSRQIHCRWTILGADLEPVRASCGAKVAPWETYSDPEAFDYVVIVGGLTSALGDHAPATFDFLRLARRRGVPVVGLCTGTFAMAEAGLLRGRRCAVHLRHREEFAERYPDTAIAMGELFVFDGDAVSCVGGTASIDLAVELVMRHCGRARALKGLTDLSVDELRTSGHLPRMPHDDLADSDSWRVAQAVRLMRSRLDRPLTIRGLAERLGTSVSQLDRDFARHARSTPTAVWRQMRLSRAKWLLLNTDRTAAGIAHECGFADGSHLARSFKAAFGETPRAFRTTRRAGVSAIPADIATPLPGTDDSAG